MDQQDLLDLQDLLEDRDLLDLLVFKELQVLEVELD
jgi:hypothetical protein